jgi:hypothetical protein
VGGFQMSLLRGNIHALAVQFVDDAGIVMVPPLVEVPVSD